MLTTTIVTQPKPSKTILNLLDCLAAATTVSLDPTVLRQRERERDHNARDSMKQIMLQPWTQRERKVSADSAEQHVVDTKESSMACIKLEVTGLDRRVYIPSLVEAI